MNHNSQQRFTSSSFDFLGKYFGECLVLVQFGELDMDMIRASLCNLKETSTGMIHFLKTKLNNIN